MTAASALFRRLALPAFAAAALAACDASSVITNVDVASNYQSIELGWFHGGDNAMRVVVHGNPFGDPPQQVAEAFVAAMQGHNGGPPMTFSTAEAPPPKPRWRIVLAVNPVGFFNTSRLCKKAEDIETTPSEGGRMRVMAAYCQGDWTASQATVRAKDITGLDSPNFDRMMALFTRILLPTRNPHQERWCGRFPCL